MQSAKNKKTKFLNFYLNEKSVVDNFRRQNFLKPFLETKAKPDVTFFIYRELIFFIFNFQSRNMCLLRNKAYRIQKQEYSCILKRIQH